MGDACAEFRLKGEGEEPTAYYGNNFLFLLVWGKDVGGMSKNIKDLIASSSFFLQPPTTTLFLVLKKQEMIRNLSATIKDSRRRCSSQVSATNFLCPILDVSISPDFFSFY